MCNQPLFYTFHNNLINKINNFATLLQEQKKAQFKLSKHIHAISLATITYLITNI